MSEYIEVGQPLQFTDPNTPTRVGEIVENVSDIYNIPSPRLGMQVFVKSEKKSFVITSLKNKVIGGVDVPEAAVEAFEPCGAKSITWNNDTDQSNMNDFVVSGVYDIKGEKKRIDDNLPILNTGSGHSFNARLTVLDSSISGSGENDDKCITQVLSFSNRLGQGEVYIRTGKGSSLDNLTWEKWSTLQRNVNVGEVGSLDGLKDNGIYSGVWKQGRINPNYLAFVCIVINDYFINIAPRRISQFVYGLNKFDGSVVYQSRVWDESKGMWGDWEILNKNEISSMIDTAIADLVGEAPETLDTLQDIAEWVSKHQDLYGTLKALAEENTKKINEEITRATEAEQDIKDKAIEADSLNFLTRANVVALDYKTIEGVGDEITIPAATTETAGVMSAQDKVDLNASIHHCVVENLEDGVDLSFDKNNDGSITVSIPSATTKSAGVMSANDKVTLNASIKNIEVSPNVGDVELDLEDNTGNINHVVFPEATTEKAGVMSAADKVTLDSIPNEIDKIKDGDTIVGQAREIHSRNGKTVTDSFLVRTTAGSGTIGDGVASLKSVGGNIVKNLVDGTFASGWDVQYANTSYTVNKVATFTSKAIDGRGRFRYKTPAGISNHIYYQKAFIKCSIAPNNKEVKLGVMNSAGSEYTATYAESTTEWQFLSIRYKTPASSNYGEVNVYDTRKENQGEINIYKYLYIDLTEKFGAGNEPDKVTCDRRFGTMDAMPQGLTVANPTAFTSTGFNQFNPDNVLEDKAITNNAIVSGDKKIAVIPCLPCKVGVGENNGYCIHGDFGNDINVYLTPLNPMEVDGELYMHKLTKDATTDTYVPQIKGYMLVEVPTTANLCAHFLWSEDKCKRDTYEPYFESKIELPTIPEMSEWGLAGIKNYCDTINLEVNKYDRKIEKIVLDGSQNWVFRANNTGYYNNNILKGREAYSNIALTDAKINLVVQDLTSNYGTISVSGSAIYLNYNETINTLGVAAFKDWLRENPITVYYVLAKPEEYPIPKVDNNYISSDYGVEQFDSVVPCNANNLYYMRSLAGETRNFLDRLYRNTAKTDAKEVADYISNPIDNIPLATTEKAGLMSPEDKMLLSSVDEVVIPNNNVEPKETTFFSRNLFNTNDSDILDNTYLGPGGDTNANGSYLVTGFIPFNKDMGKLIVSSDGNTMSTSGAAYCLYDANKQLVKGYTYKTKLVAEWEDRVAYARFSVMKGKATIISIGDTISPYIEYGKDVINNRHIANQYCGVDAVIETIESIADGDIFQITKCPYYIKKNVGISMSADLTAMGTVIVGKGYNQYRGMWVEVDNTNIKVYRYDSSAFAIHTIEHGLSINKFIRINVFLNGEGNLHIVLFSNGGCYKTNIECGYEMNYQPFVSCKGASLTNVKLGVSCADVRLPVWVFGDSYLGVTSNRWPGIMKDFGFFNVMFDGLSGADSDNMYKEIQRLLSMSTPKYIVWCLGMNDTADNYKKVFDLVKQLCENAGVTMIATTIPTVPTRAKEVITNYVKSSGVRYIDMYSAVGATSTGSWYEGMLSSDGVHPTELGAQALAMQVLTDFPEIMQY